MENDITLRGTSALFRTSLLTTLSSLLASLRQPALWLRDYYAGILGHTLSMRQTWLLVEVQAAFIAAALPLDMPVVARAACCAWLLWSLKRCRKLGS